MTDILDTIDASLEEVEEQLLIELNRVRTAPETSSDRTIDTGIRNALYDVVGELHRSLQNSGDRLELQLVTKRHEVLYARTDVLRQLLSEEIPARLLEKAHEGVEVRRRLLERRVIQQREARHEEKEPKKSGLMSGLRGIFDHDPSRQEIERNRYGITQQEAEQLQPHQDYLDNGIYSASRELAMLASLLRGGTLDTPPDAEPGMGRAIFKARDLSTRIPVANKRRPVVTREPVQEAEKPPEVEKRDIAQTPDEIRRKLEARRNRDSAGKAVFAAKDIEPAMPEQFYGRKRRDDEDDKPKEEDKPRTGRAVFEARDLSDPPSRKRD